MTIHAGAEPILLQAAFGLLLVGVVIASAVIDSRKLILPDRLNLLLATVGIAQSVVLGQPDPVDAGLGALIGGGTLLLVATVFRRIRGIEGLGYGDLKFVAAAGVWVGWQGIPLMLFVASASALAFVVIRAVKNQRLDRTARLPFGPFLGFGTVLSWLTLMPPQLTWGIWRL
jgi:leader peptidase (prepilin peptidase) / N-methyltransferase